ncbi:MAG: phage terminase large subunit [Rubrivivax sp.]|nr:phage terminase large subunit [Rubrivivax sp.]
MAKTDKEFLAHIAALAESLRRQVDADTEGWDISPEGIAARRRQAADEATGFAFFHRTYFPHYGRAAPSVLHEYLHQRLPAIVRAANGQRDAVAAPRGEAKSTVVSLVFVLWCVVQQLKHYTIIIMDAFEQAAEMLEAVKAELEVNPRLASDFPEACGRGRVWRVGCIVTANNRKLEAFGSNKKIRGRRHGPHRPDLAVLDDIENDENVLTPAQRDKLEAFVTKGVLNLGPPDDSMDAVLIGTVLHYDSVLSRFLKNRMWNRKVFKAILTWPDRMDLWERFEELLLSGDTPDEGETMAMAHYADHQVEMDAGAVVSWPAVRPLVRLMIKRARDGHPAFDSEQQNDPISGDDAPFANSIRFWVNRLAEWKFYGAVDPSMGRQAAGRDPSAVLVGGFDRERGILDVVHAQIRRRTPDKLIEDIIECQREWACIVWGFEAVVFAEFVRTELVKRSAAAGVPVPARPLNPISDKPLRIESLQPHMHNGLLRLHSSQTTLIDQFRHYPKADHDDGPDAAQMLWMLAITGGIGAGTQVEDTTARGREYFDRAARQAQRMFTRRR